MYYSIYIFFFFCESWNNQDTRIHLQKKNKIAKEKESLAIFLVSLFRILATEVTIHEKKTMAHIIFVFYEEVSWYTYFTYWDEKSIFRANWWLLKKKISTEFNIRTATNCPRVAGFGYYLPLFEKIQVSISLTLL